MKIKWMHAMLIILQRNFLCVFIISSCAVAQLQLKIDTAFISLDEYYPNEGFNLSIKYLLCNKGEKKIKHINPLWYATKFQLAGLDSSLRDKIGNTKVYLYKNGSLLDNGVDPITYDCDIPPRGPTNDQRTKLRSHECFWAWLKYWFYGKVEKDSPYVLLIEYNTLLQRTDGVRIWRGKLMSNSYIIKL